MIQLQDPVGGAGVPQGASQSTSIVFAPSRRERRLARLPSPPHAVTGQASFPARSSAGMDHPDLTCGPGWRRTRVGRTTVLLRSDRASNLAGNLRCRSYSLDRQCSQARNRHLHHRRIQVAMTRRRHQCIGYRASSTQPHNNCHHVSSNGRRSIAGSPRSKHRRKRSCRSSNRCCLACSCRSGNTNHRTATGSAGRTPRPCLRCRPFLPCRR